MNNTTNPAVSSTDLNNVATIAADTNREIAFSIMFVTVGLSCFVWQTITAGWMFYKSKKLILGIVSAQALLGVIVTIVTLLTSLVRIDCTFLLIFSIVGVNIADICLQFVLLWKAYLGNNRSKVVLVIGSIPLVGITVFIFINMTVGRSTTISQDGVCMTNYPKYIVILKAAIDCSSNTFLSACFILVIYRHYRILGSSIQKTLITEGLIYCFGVCLSNIVTGILLTKSVLGGSSPILYTVDWYLASYLIIKQLRQRDESNQKLEDDDDYDDDDDNISLDSNIININCQDEEGKQAAAANSIPSPSSCRNNIGIEMKNYTNNSRDTYYNSLDGTLVPSSPATYFSDDEIIKYPKPAVVEQKKYSTTIPIADKRTILEYDNTNRYSSSVTALTTVDDVGSNNNNSKEEERIIQQQLHKNYEGQFVTGGGSGGELPTTTRRLAISSQKSINQKSP